MGPYLKTHLGTITGSAFTKKAAHKLQLLQKMDTTQSDHVHLGAKRAGSWSAC